MNPMTDSVARDYRTRGDRRGRKRVGASRIRFFLAPPSGDKDHNRETTTPGECLAELCARRKLPRSSSIPISSYSRSGGGSKREAYFTMRLVRGQTLTKFVLQSSARLAETEGVVHVLNAFLCVCDAVAFAHSRGVVHGDIKPENIMIGSLGEVYLRDWGIARLSGERVPLG